MFNLEMSFRPRSFGRRTWTVGEQLWRRMTPRKIGSHTTAGLPACLPSCLTCSFPPSLNAVMQWADDDDDDDGDDDDHHDANDMIEDGGRGRSRSSPDSPSALYESLRTPLRRNSSFSTI